MTETRRLQIEKWLADYPTNRTTGAGQSYTAFLKAHELLSALLSEPQAAQEPSEPLTYDELFSIASIMADFLEAQEGWECQAENAAFINPLLRRVTMLASRSRPVPPVLPAPP